MTDSAIDARNADAAGARRSRTRGTLSAELVGRRAFQLANASLVVETVRASSGLVVVWELHVPWFVLGAVAWSIGTMYLWMRAPFRLPRYWYVTPLVWAAVYLIVSANVPQTVRFRILGERAFDGYVAANSAAISDLQPIDARIGGYRIVGVERVGDVVVFHADSQINQLEDQTECAVLMRVEPDKVDRWRSSGAWLRLTNLSDQWWSWNFSTRGVSCQALFSYSLAPQPDP